MIDPDTLYKNNKDFYDKKQLEYQSELKEMGNMLPVNREMPKDIAEKIEKALLSQSYIIAKTMPKNPHQYCLRKNWVGEITFEETVNTMRNYGYVEWFWGKPYMLYNIGDFKYWTMGYPTEVTILINRTTIEKCTYEEFCKIAGGEI